MAEKKKKITETKGWKWFWGIFGLYAGLLLIILKFWFGGIIVIICTLLLMPYFGEKIAKIFKFELPSGLRKALLITIFVTIFIFPFFSSASSGISKDKLSKDVSNLNPNLFFLSGNDLSTEWHYGTITDTTSGESKNGIMPIRSLSQTNAKTDGLTATAISIKSSEFNNKQESSKYYNTLIQEIINNRGYTEINLGLDICFAIDKSTYLAGNIYGYCLIDKYVLKLTYVSEYDTVSSYEYKSVLNTILNRVYN